MDEILDVPQSVRTPIIKEILPPEGYRFTVNQAIGAVRTALRIQAPVAWIARNYLIIENETRSPFQIVSNDAAFSGVPHWHDFNVVLFSPLPSSTPTLILPYEETRRAAIGILRESGLDRFIRRTPDDGQKLDDLAAPHVLSAFDFAAQRLERESEKRAKTELLPVSRKVQEAVKEHAFACRWDGERAAGIMGFRSGVLHCRSVLEEYQRTQSILFFPEKS